MRIPSVAALLLCAALGTARPAPAQDLNVLLAPDSIEQLMRWGQFEIDARSGSRFEGDRTQRVTLLYPDSSMVMVKWARAVEGGESFNNAPRYELAAYELQKLFLEPQEYVVPPTVVRTFPLEWYRQLEPRVAPTFTGTSSVLVVLQYWLYSVKQRDVFDPARLRSDEAYARSVGNLNVLTYLIRHSDSNMGNVLISENGIPPRLFAVDNGIAFLSEASDRGTEWRGLRTDRLSAAIVERLRRITRADLDRTLRVVAEFENRGGMLIPTEHAAHRSRISGVRTHRNGVQLGLTEREIAGVHSRLQTLIRQIDSGRIRTF